MLRDAGQQNLQFSGGKAVEKEMSDDQIVLALKMNRARIGQEKSHQFGVWFQRSKPRLSQR